MIKQARVAVQSVSEYVTNGSLCINTDNLIQSIQAT